MADKTSTTKTILSIIVALLVIGGAVAAWATTRTMKAQIDSTQDDRIFRAEESIDRVEVDVTGIKLQAAEELATKKAIFDTLTRMEKVQDSLSHNIGSMKIDVATTKIKVDNLEKAD